MAVTGQRELRDGHADDSGHAWMLRDRDVTVRCVVLTPAVHP
jgi:hypothetical protein